MKPNPWMPEPAEAPLREFARQFMEMLDAEAPPCVVRWSAVQEKATPVFNEAYHRLHDGGVVFIADLDPDVDLHAARRAIEHRCRAAYGPPRSPRGRGFRSFRGFRGFRGRGVSCGAAALQKAPDPREALIVSFLRGDF